MQNSTRTFRKHTERSEVIAKQFFDVKKKKKVLHWGKVISHRFDTDGELLFKISYEDGDGEELNIADMMIHVRIAMKNDRGYDFSVPAAPKQRRLK